MVRENSEEIQQIWEKLPSAKDKDNNWVWPRTNQGASSPRCPDGRTAEQGEGQVSGEDQPTGPGHARRQCSEKEQFLMFGDKDVECDLLPGVSPNAFGGEEMPHTISDTGRRYVPQKYSWIENNWVDGGNPLRVVADRSIVVEATYVSKTRLTCKAPSFDFPTHDEVAHKFRTSCLFDRFRPGPWPLKPPLDVNGDECRGDPASWHPTCKAEYPAGNPTSGSRVSASGVEWLGPNEGGDLASWMRSVNARGEALPEEVVMRWVVQLLLALQHVHALGIIHRGARVNTLFLFLAACRWIRFVPYASDR